MEESISLSGGMSVQLLEVVPFADYEMRKLVISHVSSVPVIDISHVSSVPVIDISHVSSVPVIDIRMYNVISVG